MSGETSSMLQPSPDLLAMLIASGAYPVGVVHTDESTAWSVWFLPRWAPLPMFLYTAGSGRVLDALHEALQHLRVCRDHHHDAERAVDDSDDVLALELWHVGGAASDAIQDLNLARFPRDTYNSRVMAYMTVPWFDPGDLQLSRTIDGTD